MGSTFHVVAATCPDLPILHTFSQLRLALELPDFSTPYLQRRLFPIGGHQFCFTTLFVFVSHYLYMQCLYEQHQQI